MATKPISLVRVRVRVRVRVSTSVATKPISLVAETNSSRDTRPSPSCSQGVDQKLASYKKIRELDEGVLI